MIQRLHIVTKTVPDGVLLLLGLLLLDLVLVSEEDLDQVLGCNSSGQMRLLSHDSKLCDKL